MRENRIVLISEDYGESLMYATNLDNRTLYNILVQVSEDIENGVGRTPTDILEHWQECEMLGVEQDSFIIELKATGLDWSAFEQKLICYYECYNISVITGKE